MLSTLDAGDRASPKQSTLRWNLLRLAGCVLLAFVGSGCANAPETRPAPSRLRRERPTEQQETQQTFYEEFAQQKEAELRRPEVLDAERQLGLEAVRQLRAWLGSHSALDLAATSPQALYLRRLAWLSAEVRALAPAGSGASGVRDPAPALSRAEMYQDFARRKEAELKQSGVPVAERLLGLEAVLRFRGWVYEQREAELARATPEDAYLRVWVRLRAEQREDAERVVAVEAKLHEYDVWGQAFIRVSPVRVSREYIEVRSPLLYASRLALAEATRDWAWTHRDDVDFLRKSPSEVALYLLARRASLFHLLLAGEQASGYVDYAPILDPTAYTLEELSFEMAVGFIPVFGDISDLAQGVSGTSLTGHGLEDGERVLLVLGAALPFVSGSMLHGAVAAPRVLERVAMAMGRRTEEVEALLRVASHLAVDDVRELNRIVRVAGKDGRLVRADLERLEGIAARVEGPLAQAVEVLRKSGRPTGIGHKLDLVTGKQLVPGSAEHMYQRWIDYQFRYPGKRGAFALAADPEWERLYRTILENGKAGGEFQAEALSALKLKKNTAMMMPPPGSNQLGFIPDALAEGTVVEELVWGQAYNFVEVKGRKELSNGGNLKAMLDYVANVKDSSLLLVVRSEKHERGLTYLSRPLREKIGKLGSKVKLKWLPE